MPSTSDNKLLNKSISVILIVFICILTLIFTLQGPSDESSFYEAFIFLLIPITIFQIFYVIIYKATIKTPDFWLMLILIVVSLIVCGLLWYAAQLAKGFNH